MKPKLSAAQRAWKISSKVKYINPKSGNSNLSNPAKKAINKLEAKSNASKRVLPEKNKNAKYANARGQSYKSSSAPVSNPSVGVVGTTKEVDLRDLKTNKSGKLSSRSPRNTPERKVIAEVLRSSRKSKNPIKSKTDWVSKRNTAIHLRKLDHANLTGQILSNEGLRASQKMKSKTKRNVNYKTKSNIRSLEGL